MKPGIISPIVRCTMRGRLGRGLAVALALVLEAACSRQNNEDLLTQHRNLGKAFYENPTTKQEAVREFRAGARTGPGFRTRETELRARVAAGVRARRRSRKASSGGATPGSFAAAHLVQPGDLLQAAGRRESGDRAIRRNARASARRSRSRTINWARCTGKRIAIRKRRPSSKRPRSWIRCWRPLRSNSTICTGWPETPRKRTAISPISNASRTCRKAG